MEPTPAASTVLPPLVRLESLGVCGCGEAVPAGERAGYLSSEEGIVCVGCLAHLQSGRLDLDDLLARTRPHGAVADVAAAKRRILAARHSQVVSGNADSLLSRFTAIRAMASLEGELRPLSAFVVRQH